MPAKSAPDVFETLADKLAALVNQGAPAIEMLEPGWAPAISLFSKLLTSAANAEPHAVEMVKSIKDGNLPAPEDVEALAASYGATVEALDAPPASVLDQITAHLDNVPGQVAQHVSDALASTPTADANAAAAKADGAVRGLIDEIKAGLAGLFGKH